MAIKSTSRHSAVESRIQVSFFTRPACEQGLGKREAILNVHLRSNNLFFSKLDTLALPRE